jgi:hypothetical protein
MTPDESTQLALLVQEVRALRQAVEKNNEDHETRIRLLESGASELKSKIVALQERLTLWQIFQVIFTTTIGSIAAFLRRP